MIYDGTESVEGGTGWYLVVLGQYNLVLLSISLVFSDLFHERLHDGTTSNAQNHELERSRPVVMLKLNIIVTLSMMGANVKEFISNLFKERSLREISAE